MSKKTYEEELQYYMSMSIPEQIENLKTLGKELDERLKKLINQLDQQQFTFVLAVLLSLQGEP